MRHAVLALNFKFKRFINFKKIKFDITCNTVQIFIISNLKFIRKTVSCLCVNVIIYILKHLTKLPYRMKYANGRTKLKNMIELLDYMVFLANNLARLTFSCLYANMRNLNYEKQIPITSM